MTAKRRSAAFLSSTPSIAPQSMLSRAAILIISTACGSALPSTATIKSAAPRFRAGAEIPPPPSRSALRIDLPLKGGVSFGTGQSHPGVACSTPRLLPQAHALKPADDFADEIGQLVEIIDQRNGNPGE